MAGGAPAAAGAATAHLTPSQRRQLQQGLAHARQQRALGQGASPTSGLGAPNTGGPLSPGLPQGAAPTATTTTPTAPVLANPTTGTSSGGGLSGGSTVAIGIGALAVLGGISFFIWRDARRRAPVRHHAAAATAGAGGRSGSKKPRPKQQRKLSPAERRRRKRGRAR